MLSRKSSSKKNLFWDVRTPGGEEAGDKPAESGQLRFANQLAGEAPVTDENVEEGYRDLMEKIARAEDAGKRRPIFNYRFAAAVAGLLLMAFAGIYTYRYFATVTVQTAFGQTRSLQLPDGSVVTLNANSTLRYPSFPGMRALREVELEGEAFFRVKKAGKPANRVKFVVHTDELDVEVLGTEFNVSTRRAGTQVVLQSGSVQLSLKGPGQEVILMKPGDLVAVTGNSWRVEQKLVNPRQYAGWQHHEWVLNDAPLRELTDKIEDSFGLKVEFADTNLAGLRLHGRFPSDNLNKLMQILSASAGVQVRQEGNTLIIQ